MCVEKWFLISKCKFEKLKKVGGFMEIDRQRYKYGHETTSITYGVDNVRHLEEILIKLSHKPEPFILHYRRKFDLEDTHV